MQDDFSEVIHQNRGGTRRVGDIPIRNLIEGIIESVIALIIIAMIPFVPNLKLMLIILFSISTMAFNIMGFRNRSLTEILFMWIRFQKSKKILKLRSSTENAKSRVKTEKEKSPYFTKIREYFSDDNLEQGNGITKVIIREIKGFLQIITDSFHG